MTQENIVSTDMTKQVLYYMQSMHQDATLMECLIAMQTAEGIDEATAEANAQECMLAVCAWESLYAQISDKTAEITDSLLKSMEKMEESQRMLALHKLLFGLTVWDDPDSAQAMEAGANAQMLFWQHYKKVTESPDAPTAQELEAQIRKAMATYRLSPTAMRMLSWKMRHGDGCLATAEALGEEGRNLKCLMTMDVWLRNRDTMTMAEAANQAASSAQTQAVADALQRGFITREVAKKLLVVLGIAVAVFGIICLIQSIPALAAALKALALGPNPTGVPMSPLLTDLLTQQAAKSHALAFGKQAIGALVTVFGAGMVYFSDKAARLITRIHPGYAPLSRPASPDVPPEDPDVPPEDPDDLEDLVWIPGEDLDTDTLPETDDPIFSTLWETDAHDADPDADDLLFF